MDSLGLLLLSSFALVCFIIVRHLKSNNKGCPTNWPIVGMLPAVLSQHSRIHDYITEVVTAISETNFAFRGPWFSNMDMLITMEPANVNYVMTTNFANFPKGSKFKSIFDFFGDAIFISDDELWKESRRTAISVVNHEKFHQLMLRTVQEKVQDALIPIMYHTSKEGQVVDLQDLFQRLATDSICKLITGIDQRSLSHDLPESPFSKALDDVNEAIFYRLLLPGSIWKLQGIVGIGAEKKLTEARKCSWKIVEEYITTQRERLCRGEESKADEVDHDLLSSYLRMERKEIAGLDCHSDKFLRDTILSLILAGRDTTTAALTYFFYCLSKNPSAETKIREEITSLGVEREDMFENKTVVKKLVYLHAAICESLRLYPPVPFTQKSPIKPDKLPSGHVVQAMGMIMISLYAMARLPSVWGEDAMEFKPERWIDEDGKIKHVPTYKFLTFHAGPRTCIGKDIALVELKIMVATILRNFHVRVEEDQDISPCPSFVLYMKHGLKARISKIPG